MKILHLIKHVQFGHGNAHAAVDLACAQAAQGDSVVVASGGGDFEGLLAQEGVSHWHIAQDAQPAAIAGAVIGIDRLVQRLKPDVMHAHMVTSVLLGRLAAWRHRVPLFATAHNPFDPQVRLLKWSDVVVGVSSASASRLTTQLPSIPVRTALNGTLGAPRRAFFPAERYEVAPLSIGTICGLHPRKGVEELIAAYEQVARSAPQSRLYIAGDGPMRAQYEALARASDARRQIVFMGQIRDSRQFLDALDIFVLASHAEGPALVLPEAREAGCAMIGTDVDGTREALDDGKAGILVPPGSRGRLAEAMGSLLTDSAKLRNMQRRARVGVDAFRVARVALDYDRIYREAISMRGERKVARPVQLTVS